MLRKTDAVGNQNHCNLDSKKGVPFAKKREKGDVVSTAESGTAETAGRVVILRVKLGSFQSKLFYRPYTD